MTKSLHFMMARRFFIAFTLLLLNFNGKSEGYRNVTISLLTASPGTELYSIFGHTAIRVQDPLNETDIVYNYGVFDFNTPNFGLKFLRGNLDYMLAANRYSDFFQSYLWEERSLFEQTLNLTSDQKEKIVRLLEENYLPENRYYRYSFLSDNCATRVRDIITKGISDTSVFERSKMTYPPLSYRQMLREFLKDFPWVDLGINLAMGLPSDKLTTTSEKMFLPEYMKEVTSESITRDGKPLVAESRTLLSDVKEPFQTVNFLTPISLFFALLTLSLIGYSSQKYSRIFCSAFYFSLGLLGIVLTITTFATSHPALRWNLNLLWALPLNIVFFRAAGKNSVSKLVRYYFIIIAIIAALLIVSWGNFPQQFHPAIIPILLTIITTATQISIQRYTPKKLHSAIKTKQQKN